MKMKNILLPLMVIVFIVLGVISCASGPKFSDITGQEWKLTDVLFNGKSINFDRGVLVSEGFGEIFTLNFDAERLSGVGAPNRYTAPYTLGKDKDRTMSVQMVAGTMMAPIRQPEKLKEHDFFQYIQNAYKWNLVNLKLELLSKSQDGAEVTLVFTL